MENSKLFRIKSVNQIHSLIGLKKTNHPLITLVDLSEVKSNININSVILDFYVISLKRGCNNLIYGHQEYDFDEGLMAFMSPNQILSSQERDTNSKLEGWMLFIHPDFFWGTSIAQKIKRYEYFKYSVKEALFLSAKEEKIINDIVKNIKNEYDSNIDKFSQDIIISHIETLLNYAERFYQRQFITRKITNHQILDQLENLLSDYFNDEDLIIKGLPTVKYISDKLHISPNYLRSLLKSITGENTQQHIHNKLIEKAKEKLSTTDLSISEISYQLGFEHLQSFSKLFKVKTKLSPLEFRQFFR